MPRRILKHARENPTMWRWFTAVAAIVAFTALSMVFWKDKVTRTFETEREITGRELVLSEPSKEQIKKFVNNDKNILAGAAVRASLTKNQRSTIFFYSDDKDLQAVWDEYLTRRVASPPALFANESTVQNDRIANVLNGAFDCRRFNLTISYQFFPNADRIAPWVCTLSVPPGFDGSGDFNGFLTFYFAKEPTDAEKKTLAKNASEISKDIYRRDVENEPAK